MYNGIFLMNKPKGFTSHDVIAKLRGILKFKKIGHSGTLDPMATGVLPIFLGYATRASDYASSQSKEYIVNFKLGTETDTLDITGRVLHTSDKKVHTDEIISAINSFKGEITQVPPMYSAVQINGQRLYALARKGIAVERPTRDVTIHNIDILDIKDEISVKLLVSKGTYIRSFCSDVGNKLGTYAVMTDLIRTKSGDYSIENTWSFEQVKDLVEKNQLSDILIKTDTVFKKFPRVDVDDYGYSRILNGAFITCEHIKNLPPVNDTISRVYYKDEFIMLGKTGELDKGGSALFVHKRFC